MTHATIPRMVWPSTKGTTNGPSWSHSIWKVKLLQSMFGGWPTGASSRPTHMLLPMIGKIVQGLLMKAPAKMATRFKRNAHAQKRAVRAWSPYVGVKEMNAPTANASAVRRGGSPRWRMWRHFSFRVGYEIIRVGARTPWRARGARERRRRCG